MQPAPPLQDELFFRSEFVSVSDSIHRLLNDCDSLSAVGAYSLAGWSWMTAGSSVSRLQQHQLQYEPSLSLSSSLVSPIDALRTSHQERGARLVSILESSLVSLFQFKLSALSISSPGSPTSPRSSYTGSEPPEVFSGRVSRVSSPMASSRVSPTFFGDAANQWLSQPRQGAQTTTSTVSFSVTSVERLHDLLDCAERIGALVHLLTTVLPSHLMTSLFSHILSGSAKLSAPTLGSTDSLELSFATQPFATPSPITVATQVALFANYIKAKLIISHQDNSEQKPLRIIESAQTRVPNSPAAGGGASAIKRLALTSPRISRNASGSRNNARSEEEVNSSAPSMSDPQRRLLTILQKSLALIGRSLWCGVPGAGGVGKLLSEMVVQSMPQSLDLLRGWLDNELHPLGLIEIELAKMNFLEDTDDTLPFRSALAATPIIYATRAREAILRSARDSCNLPLPSESHGTRLIMSSPGEKSSEFITVLATPANTKRFGTKLSSGNTSSFSLTSTSHDSIDFHAAVTRLLPMQVSTATLQLTKLVRETNEAAILAASAGYSTLSRNFVLAAREIVGIYLAVMSTRMLSPSKEPSISLQMDVFRRGALFHNDCLLMAHVLARLSLLDNAANVFSDLIPSLQIAARESFSIQTEMMKNALTEAVLSESDTVVSDDSEGPTAAIATQAGKLKLIGTMLAEVLSRTNFIRLFGTLADLCILNACKASFEEIQRALLSFEPTSGARGERSNVIASLRISSNIRLLLDIASEILGLDSSNPPTLFIKTWDRAKALVLVLSLSLMKVREKALSGFFGKVTLRGGQPAMTKEEVATILTFRFSPALGQKGIQLELKNL